MLKLFILLSYISDEISFSSVALAAVCAAENIGDRMLTTKDKSSQQQ
jgi:hypothetical protein